MTGNCDICKTNTDLDRHHIHSKSLGGGNEKSNITHICPLCHRQVHIGKIILEGWFLSTAGKKLIYHTKGASPITGEIPEVHIFGAH